MKSEDNQQKAVNAQVSINSKIKSLDYTACIDAMVTPCEGLVVNKIFPSDQPKLQS